MCVCVCESGSVSVCESLVLVAWQREALVLGE